MNSHDDEKFTSELLRNAGRPPAIPWDDIAAIRDAARAAWEERYVTPRNRFRRERWLLPVAAALLIGIGLALWISNRPSVVQPAIRVIAASVERVTGTVALTQGGSLFSGAIVETDGASRASLRLAGGQSLRLDAGTRVRLVTPALVELQRGAVYVDSARVDQLTIQTAAGQFNPIGTQFEVRVGEGSTRLSVREGRVAFDHDQQRDIAGAGEQLSVAASRDVTRSPVRSDDPRWQWVVDIARIPAIEGQTLDAFLRLYVREKGWTLEYSTGAAAGMGSTTILHGSVEGMSLDEALRTVVRSSGAEIHVVDGVLRVTAG